MSELGEKVIKAIRAKVAEDPTYVYAPRVGDDQCMYVLAGQPSCLVGHGLWEAGIIDASLEEAKAGRFRFTDPNFDLIDNLLAHLDIAGQFTPDEIAWLKTVQEIQDDNRSWGFAVESADASAYEAQDHPE